MILRVLIRKRCVDRSREKGGHRGGWGGQRKRERFKDAILLALNMEE